MQYSETEFYVYIMSNQTNTVTYTGITNDFIRRVSEHKSKLNKGFTEKYNINKLVYFEAGGDVDGAIFREKQIKAYKRVKKVALIESTNPKWLDLYPDLLKS
jgi:putative endonuclease